MPPGFNAIARWLTVVGYACVLIGCAASPNGILFFICFTALGVYTLYVADSVSDRDGHGLTRQVGTPEVGNAAIRSAPEGGNAAPRVASEGGSAAPRVASEGGKAAPRGVPEGGNAPTPMPGFRERISIAVRVHTSTSGESTSTDTYTTMETCTVDCWLYYNVYFAMAQISPIRIDFTPSKQSTLPRILRIKSISAPFLPYDAELQRGVMATVIRVTTPRNERSTRGTAYWALSGGQLSMDTYLGAHVTSISLGGYTFHWVRTSDRGR